MYDGVEIPEELQILKRRVEEEFPEGDVSIEVEAVPQVTYRFGLSLDISIEDVDEYQEITDVVRSMARAHETEDDVFYTEVAIDRDG